MAITVFVGERVTSRLWTKPELIMLFRLYCETPFGRMHQRNPDVVRLAHLLERTPSAVAMKLTNFASLDPVVTASGRRGLPGASKLDQVVWDEFHADWDGLIEQSDRLLEQQGITPGSSDQLDLRLASTDDEKKTETLVSVKVRTKQQFFRRAVLASYGGRCCMSGTADTRLLVASHIVPWSVDTRNRLNPSNGLCLSVWHDKAFDLGLITLTDDLQIKVARQLSAQRENAFISNSLLSLAGQAIVAPERFRPAPAFLAYHRNKVFLDQA